MFAFKRLFEFCLIFALSDQRQSEESVRTIEMLETIDDDLDKHSINMIKTSDPEAAADYGIDSTNPRLVYFENGIPSLYPGMEVLHLYRMWFKHLSFNLTYK